MDRIRHSLAEVSYVDILYICVKKMGHLTHQPLTKDGKFSFHAPWLINKHFFSRPLTSQTWGLAIDGMFSTSKASAVVWTHFEWPKCWVKHHFPPGQHIQGSTKILFNK